MTDEETFGSLFERWAQAVADRDRDALDRIFDPAYSYTSPDGQRMTRREIMEIEMDVPPPELPLLDLRVQRIGDDVAIVRGAHRLKGEFKTTGNVRPELLEEIARGIVIAFTSVWRHGVDGWRVVSNDAHVVRDS